MELGYNCAGVAPMPIPMKYAIRIQSEQEIGHWLGLHSLPDHGIKYGYLRMLVDRFEGPGAWTASRNEILRHDNQNFTKIVDQFIDVRKNIDTEKLLDDCRKAGVEPYSIADPRYPFPLREIHDPPLVLFVRGSLFELDWNHAVAVVGTRRPTAYGTKFAKEMARGLCEQGAAVTSGLALGVDSLAHWGAIEGGGRTIAVLASGPDLCYPSSNKRLYAKILDGHGAGVSEFFPGTQPEKWHFPARNRIISGLSRGTVIIEAGEDSGALITAELAFNQNRDVFCLPGRVDSPMSVGTHRLIMTDKAHLVRNAADVLEKLSWVTTTYREVRTVVELMGREKDIYDMLSHEPMHFDVLCERASMQAGELSATLTMLELAGVVERLPGDWFTRVEMGIGVSPTLPVGS
jgi:DNA processing protein